MLHCVCRYCICAVCTAGAHHIRSFLIIVQRFNFQVLVSTYHFLRLNWHTHFHSLVQTNVLVLSWAKNGHFIALGEKIGVPVLLVYMMIVTYVAWAAVSNINVGGY